MSKTKKFISSILLPFNTFRYVFRLHNYILHYGYFQENGDINDKNVVCHVDMKRRLNLSRNHTTTHLVNKILRELLNDYDLIQKASLIHEDYFIFEYSSINIHRTNQIFQELEEQVGFNGFLFLTEKLNLCKYNRRIVFYLCDKIKKKFHKPLINKFYHFLRL